MCDGGLSGPFATLGNTIGVGDPVPAGINSLGSGDKYPVIGSKPAVKKSAPANKKERKQT